MSASPEKLSSKCYVKCNVKTILIFFVPVIKLQKKKVIKMKKERMMYEDIFTINQICAKAIIRGVQSGLNCMNQLTIHTTERFVLFLLISDIIN